VIKPKAALPGNLAVILVGVTAGMPADNITVQGFVLDGNTPPGSGGFLIVVDRGQRFVVNDVYLVNATYGVATQGASGVVERCLMTNMGEGVLVFGGNSTNWPSDVTVRNTRSVNNFFGGLVFFGSAFSPNTAFPPLADFGAYTGVFQPVPFSGILNQTVGRVIHNDLSRNTASPTSTSGLRMALIGPNLPAGQAAGNLVMTVNDNRLNDNAHAFVTQVSHFVPVRQTSQAHSRANSGTTRRWAASPRKRSLRSLETTRQRCLHCWRPGNTW